GLRGPVACVDGSHVVDAGDHATLLHRGIRGEHATRLRESLKYGGCVSFVFAKDRIVHDERGKSYVGYVSTWSTDVTLEPSVIEHDLWGHDDGVTAVVSIGTEGQVALSHDSIRATVGDAVQMAMYPIRRLAGMWGMIVRAAGGS